MKNYKLFKSEIHTLKTVEAVKKLGSPFGTFGLYYKGEFITYELMSEKGLDKLLKKLND